MVIKCDVFMLSTLIDGSSHLVSVLATTFHDLCRIPRENILLSSDTFEHTLHQDIRLDTSQAPKKLLHLELFVLQSST